MKMQVADEMDYFSTQSISRFSLILSKSLFRFAYDEQLISRESEIACF